ncbi:DUF305 domain-containing protein [Parvularcula sp. IMCC14364]|uniref:DUF305 domain-containing protein n=1 Tax=Parvularcula sp. IMCC14364 TaxID=3067902 RepID=UPI00274151FD|nr:DUF305 domain-containing protein [Parvularcula sp. IMCC14364]
MRLSKREMKYTLGSTVALALFACASGAAAQDVPIIQPGAPGEPGRALSADEAAKVADTRYTEDDVRFMQDMIPHHYQAVEMAALVGDRTNRAEIVDLAGRINASQADEIAFMQTWLRDRGEHAPDPMKQHDGEEGHDHHQHNHHKTHMDHEMMGMATPEQMEQLAASEGAAFDRLFLELMIPHHEGAVRMSRDLLSQSGSAYDPVLYDFVNDIINDQDAEIRRMTALLAGLSEDPRVGLAAGFRDAGEAISNLELVATLPKPQGFFDPENPAGLPPIIDPDEDEEEDEETATEWGARSPLLSFSNTDMAFVDDTLIVGNYHGFNIYKLDEEGLPSLTSSVVCPGGQGDVSVVGDILIMSVEQTRGRVDCGQQGITEDVSAERFRGLRIFDISDLSQPVQVGQVQTCRGSHTHSVVSGPGRDGKIIVYNSGTASVRDDEELAGCIGDIPGDDRTALFRIDVVEIPVDDPSKARIVDSPAVFADPETGALAGLWRGGDHGEDTQETEITDQCHDITVFPSAKIAAGACSGNGIIFDISNPLKPRRIDAVVDKGFAYWHSATFNNDGTKVLFTDEWGGGGRPRCRVHDPMDWGANALYDIEDGKLEFRSHYKLPAPQSDEENCVAHNGSIIPVPGRDIFAQAWYQGGLSLIDFTDSSNPVEIGYFDRGPVHPERMMVGGFWSTYWYNGRIYGTEIIRGLDVFALKPSDYLTENEIAAALLADQGAVFNPQQQLPVTWPAVPVVAHAYLDQLERGKDLSADRLSALRMMVDTLEAGLAGEERNTSLARDVRQTARDLRRVDANGQAAKRLAALAETLQEMADQLR